MLKKELLLERLRKSSFPPAAVLGAFVSFVTTAFRSRPEMRAESPKDGSLIQISFSEQPRAASPTRNIFPMKYFLDLRLGSGTSMRLFSQSLSGIAVDSSDRIYVLGDGNLKIFSPQGDQIRGWRAPVGAQCLDIGADGRVYFGLKGQIEFYSFEGIRIGGFGAGVSGRPANVTAIKTYGREILVADAAARYIRRYNEQGKQLGTIGTQGKTRSFMLPNRSLDLDVDSQGVVQATDSGRHRVSSWDLAGAPMGYFGKFGQANPEDFVGCCNPVNLAITPDGKIVTGEKVIARVKVYDSKGELLALIGPEHFDPMCTHLHLAVDSRGRILVADPVRLEVKIFSALIEPGSRNSI